jgi:iron complex outermembrane receptor protein
LTLSLNVNNIFNVLPEWSFTNATPTGQAILGAAVTNSPSNSLSTNVILK